MLVDINFLIQPLFRHFASSVRFEYCLHDHFRVCFQQFSWIILSLEQKNPTFCGKMREITGLTHQNYATFESKFEQEEPFNQNMSRNHCQRLFKSITYAKIVIFMPQQLLSIPQPYLLMHLINVMLIIMTSFLTMLSYFLKV